MRQVLAYVKEGEGKQALEIAKSMGGTNLATFKVSGSEENSDIVLIYASNNKIEPLIGKLQDSFDEVRLSFFPSGVITLNPPVHDAPDQVTDITHRSPIEVFLGGLQSIGSWKGFLSYSVAAGLVVWIGLFTNVVYLLVAAMLIAPFAGPAMTLALGTARGDKGLISSSVLRYFTSLAVCILTAAGLSFIMRQEIATEMMVATSKISSITSLLAITAGAAGALTLCQSERNSLVTAAGPGMLVAASLAPPAGIIGMAAAIGEWDIVKNCAFLIITQLIGINLAGSIVFHFYGVRPKGVRYDRGQKWLRFSSMVASLLLLGGILAWQFSNPTDLQRSSESKRVEAVVKKHLNSSPISEPVLVSAKFTRADIKNQNTILITTHVQNDSQLEASEVKKILVRELKTRIKQEGFKVTPLIDVIVLEQGP